MDTEVKSQYKVGDKLWYARCEWVAVKNTCPICFGNLVVKLILGNGEEVILPCECCARGYNPPTGYVEEYEYVNTPQLVTITNITTTVSESGTKTEYKASPYVYEMDQLFPTEEEARVKGIELKAELEKEQETKAKYLKEKASKSFSWNAGYHLREAKRLRKQAEYHEKKAVLCKARSKDVKGEEDESEV